MPTDLQALRRVAEAVRMGRALLAAESDAEIIIARGDLREILDDRDRLARRVEAAERLAWGAAIVERTYLWRCHHRGGATNGCNVHRPVKTDGVCSCGVDELRREIRNALAAFDTDRECDAGLVDCAGQHARGAHDVVKPDTERGEG